MLALVATATPLAAQEFIQQTLFVAPLHSVGDRRLAQLVAAGVRSRVAKLSNKRELRVLNGDTTEHILEFAGYKPDTVVGGTELRDLARLLRADEIVVGTVTGKRGGPVEVTLDLALARDWRLRQPLPVVRAATVAAASDSLAREIVRARTQMIGLRRCENAAREAEAARAVEEARRAVEGYSRSTLARTCLAEELVMTGAGSDSIAAVTEAILAVDSLNIIAAVIRAEALAALKRPAESAAAWGRVVELRPDSLDLGVRAVEWTLRLHAPAVALTAARRLLMKHDRDPQLRRLMFRAHSALGDYTSTAALGDSLDAEDVEFRNDSVLAASHVVALRGVGDTLAAVSKAARSVKQHPNDPILYLEYLQLVAGENGAAFQRGLERFPEVPELHVLAATAARTTGNAANEMASLRAAVRLDSQMTRGYLRMAELWFSQKRADSAVATLARAPRSGDDAELLRAYAMGRGMQSLRDTAVTADAWHTTISLIALADSVNSRDDTRSLIAAVSMQLAQNQLTTAARTKQCSGTRDARSSLAMADAALSRGVGTGRNADELREGYTQLSAAAGNLSKLLCGNGDVR